MSHYSSAPRRGWVLLHHTAGGNDHTVEDGRFCNSGYDFTVSREGRIFVCGSRWQQASGAHAIGCNCQAIGIAMHGCFGDGPGTCGCAGAGGGVASPTPIQRCSVAYLIAHLGTPLAQSRLRPHSNCFAWNPCESDDPTATCCPGWNYTSDTTNWNASGQILRNSLLGMAQTYRDHGCCQTPCPDPV